MGWNSLQFGTMLFLPKEVLLYKMHLPLLPRSTHSTGRALPNMMGLIEFFLVLEFLYFFKLHFVFFSSPNKSQSWKMDRKSTSISKV